VQNLGLGLGAQMLMNLFGQVWTPYTREPSMVAGGEVGLDTVDSSRVMAENQLQMQRHREIGL
jgi:hypothetical protein